jgi:hypothetical protein
MNKKTKYRKDKTKLPSKDLTHWLLTGCLNFGIPADRESQRKLWQENKDAILRVWIQVLPGCRPFGFWAFDAPERRECISDVHLYDLRDFPEPLKKFVFGIPTIYDRRGRQEFESEYGYLSRLELLTESELDLSPDKMQGNSCGWIRRTDAENIAKVMRLLGFE